MKGPTLIIGLILYSSVLFLINSFEILLLLSVFEILTLIFLGSKQKTLKFFLKNCGFVVFVILCNLYFSGWMQSLLIGARLWLAIGATYIVSRLLTTREFAHGIAMLCAPLRIFNVDTSELEISIMVALTFIPLLAKEAESLQHNLKLKGYSSKNFWKQPHIYVVGIVKQLFDHAEAAEKTLRLRGYE